MKSYGSLVKVDDGGSTLAHKARVVSSWTIGNLLVRMNFLSCHPINEVVERLVAMGHVRRDGFSLVINHWDQTRNHPHYNLKFQVSISLFNPSLVCWNPDAVAIVVAGFKCFFELASLAPIRKT